MANLRNLLHSLRQSLPEIDPYLQVDSQSITLEATACCEVDVIEFESHIALATKSGSSDEKQAKLKSAIEFYSGKLLPAFLDEWVEAERESLHHTFDDAVAQLIQLSRIDQDLNVAIRYAKLRVTYEPLSERSQHELIELLWENGDRAAALLAFQNYRRKLEAEMGIAPGSELLALHQKIVNTVPQLSTPGTEPATPTASLEPSPALESPPSLEPSSSSSPPSTAAKTSNHRIGWLTTAFALLAIGFVFYILNSAKDSQNVERSLAILPFEDHSHNRENRYFADGFHNELISQVSRIHDIRTISRTSVMGYRNPQQKLSTVADELGVSVILEGAVQRSGDQIRVNVQLLDAPRDRPLWSQSYTKKLTADNVFRIQSEIIADIARALQTELSPSEQERAQKIPTKNLSALESYFKARTYSEDLKIERAIESYSDAIELDSTFAEAYAGLAGIYLDQIYFRGLNKEEQLGKAKELIESALSLDPRSSEAHVALGTYKRFTGDLGAALEAYQKAIELNPNNATAYFNSSLLYQWHFSKPEEAFVLSQKAISIDPSNHQSRTTLTASLVQLGRFEEAKEILESFVRSAPANPQAYYSLGTFQYQIEYRYDQAINTFQEGFRLDPKDHNFAREIAICYAALGLYEKAAEHMATAIELSPEGPEAQVCRAMIELYQGHRDRAVALFDSISAKGDYYRWAVLYPTWADIRAGNFANARDRILAAYPSLRDLQNLTIDRLNYRFVAYLAKAHAGLGQPEKAKELADAAQPLLKSIPRHGHGGFGLLDAKLAAALGDKEKTLTLLQKAVVDGYTKDGLAEMPLFADVRETPRFQEILDQISDRLALQRENLR